MWDDALWQTAETTAAGKWEACSRTRLTIYAPRSVLFTLANATHPGNIQGGALFLSFVCCLSLSFSPSLLSLSLSLFGTRGWDGKGALCGVKGVCVRPCAMNVWRILWFREYCASGVPQYCAVNVWRMLHECQYRTLTRGSTSPVLMLVASPRASISAIGNWPLPVVPECCCMYLYLY